MLQPEPPPNDSLLGRFIVELPGERRVGLSFDEAALLRETPRGREAIVYRIHRISEDGRMELIGVSDAALRRSACFAYHRNEVREARLDFDGILEHARITPPPCRIELRLLREAPPQSASLVALKFPEVCADAVKVWLAAIGRSLGDPSAARPIALSDFDAERLQAVMKATIEPKQSFG